MSNLRNARVAGRILGVYIPRSCMHGRRAASGEVVVRPGHGGGGGWWQHRGLEWEAAWGLGAPTPPPAPDGLLP